MCKESIGVFDSGVGGLSVLREIRALLPGENLLYVADSGYAPYGDRTEEFILERVQHIASFMLAEGVKSIVIACNTASAVAVHTLRSQVTLPVVAMEPAVKPAASVTKTGLVGVLATRRTLESAHFARLIERYGGNVRFVLQACPGFVEQVEKGDLDGPQTVELVRSYVEPLIAQGVDTLVLGCTHYPFLAPVIRQVAGDGIQILDPSNAVARQVRRRLEETGLLANGKAVGEEVFWTSGEPARVAPVIERLWSKQVRVLALPAVHDASLGRLNAPKLL